MNKGRWLKFIFIIGIFLLAWIVFAHYCMKFRVSDADAKRNFLAKGVQLFTGDFTDNGFTIHYAKTGSDSLPTLVFIHGSPGSWYAYEKYMKDTDLLSKFRMISIDRPGFGYSEFGDSKNLEEQSRLMSPLLKTFSNGKPMYIAGHSMGGPVAVKLVIDNPDLFSGMVLLSAAIDPEGERPEIWRGWIYKPPFKFFVPGAFLPSDKELWYLKKDLWKMQDELDSIKCNVWAVHGDKDVFVPVASSYFSKKRMVKAKKFYITIIHGANHFITSLHYDEIKKVLMQLHP